MLTLPHELRRRIAYDRELLAKVGRIFVSSVLGFYRRRLASGEGKGRGKSGAVVVVQRSSSDLKLNPHFHGLFLDGVYRTAAGAAPAFAALSRLSTSDVADVLQTVRGRIVRYVVRPGVVEVGAEASWSDAGPAPRNPVLAQLAAAAVSGLPPAGPPIADEHLRLLTDDLVRIQLKRPFRDGTYAVDLDPLSLLSRLAAAVPPPRQHTVRYAGVLAAAAKWRAAIVPQPPSDHDAETVPPSPAQAATPPSTPRAGASPTGLSTFRDVPWNGPFYRKHGFIDLEPAQWTAGMPVIRENEAEHGLRTEARSSGVAS